MKGPKKHELENLIKRLKDPNEDSFFMVDRNISTKNISTKKAGDNYIKIDSNNILKPMDENYNEKVYQYIEKNISKEHNKYTDIINIINEVLKKINNFSYEDLFDYCLKMAKKINIKTEDLEPHVNLLLKQNQTLKLNSLDLNFENLSAIGSLLTYSYKNFEKYKIKDFNTLMKKKENIFEKDINIFVKFVIWQSLQKNPAANKFLEFLKKERKCNDCPPEIIILLNNYIECSKITLDINKLYRDKLLDNDYKIFEIAILNLHWILISIKTIELKFFSQKLEKSFFGRNREKLSKLCSNCNFTLKPNDFFFNNVIFTLPKWNFSSNLKYNEDKSKIIKAPIPWLDSKSFFIGKSEIVLRSEVIKENINLFELIFLTFFSLNYYKKYINFQLIMNDCFITEFFLLMKEVYKLELANLNNIRNFHIFDLLLHNNLMEFIDKLNIEVNCLDSISFNKLLSFLYYNKSIIKLNISLFSADIFYTTQYLYNIYYQKIDNPEVVYNELKKKFDKDTYLFCENKEIEDKLLDKLSDDFINSLSSLFEFIKKKENLVELGFNIHIPFNIINKSKYINALYKFILNILFYISKHKIIKFCLISPSMVFSSETKPNIDTLLKSISINKNKKLEEITVQMQFDNIKSITTFINTRLKILNLGNLNFNTFQALCEHISSETFDKNASLEAFLEEISIGLDNSISEFTNEIQILIGKLCGLKIKSLISLSLLTNICLTSKNQYFDLLKLINYNWINKIVITLDNNCENIYEEEKKKLKDLKCIIPYFLEKKLIKENKLKNRTIQDKNVDNIYWSLKNFMNKKYFDYNNDLNSEYEIKKMLFDIFKYTHIIKTPDISHIYQYN